MSLALAPELERRLIAAASRQGVPTNEYVANVLDKHLSQTEKEQREELIALMQSWMDESDGVDEFEALDQDFLRRLDEGQVTTRKVNLADFGY